MGTMHCKCGSCVTRNDCEENINPNISNPISNNKNINQNNKYFIYSEPKDTEDDFFGCGCRCSRCERKSKELISNKADVILNDEYMSIHNDNTLINSQSPEKKNVPKYTQGINPISKPSKTPQTNPPANQLPNNSFTNMANKPNINVPQDSNSMLNKENINTNNTRNNGINSNLSVLGEKVKTESVIINPKSSSSLQNIPKSSTSNNKLNNPSTTSNLLQKSNVANKSSISQKVLQNMSDISNIVFLSESIKLSQEEKKRLEEAKRTLRQFSPLGVGEINEFRKKIRKEKWDKYITADIGDISDDTVVFNGMLNKMINYEISAHNPVMYSERFCVLYPKELKYYKSKIQFLRGLPPLCVVPLSQITRVNYAKIREKSKKIDHIILCNQLGIRRRIYYNNEYIDNNNGNPYYTMNNSHVYNNNMYNNTNTNNSNMNNSYSLKQMFATVEINSYLNSPETNESLLIFSSDNEDSMCRWYVLLQYFISIERGIREENVEDNVDSNIEENS